MLAITGAIEGNSQGKIYQELGLETLKSRRCYKRLNCIFKVINEEAPKCLIKLIPKCHHFIRTRNSQIPSFHCRPDCFKYWKWRKGGLPCPFWKLKKPAMILEKKCPDYDLPWITFSIQNVFLRIIFKQQRRILLLRHCCMLYFSPILVFVSSLL